MNTAARDSALCCARMPFRISTVRSEIGSPSRTMISPLRSEMVASFTLASAALRRSSVARRLNDRFGRTSALASGSSAARAAGGVSARSSPALFSSCARAASVESTCGLGFSVRSLPEARSRTTTVRDSAWRSNSAASSMTMRPAAPSTSWPSRRSSSAEKRLFSR